MCRIKYQQLATLNNVRISLVNFCSADLSVRTLQHFPSPNAAAVTGRDTWRSQVWAEQVHKYTSDKIGAYLADYKLNELEV